MLERLAAGGPREMRRTILAAFGNAKLAGHDAIEVADLPEGAQRAQVPDRLLGRRETLRLEQRPRFGAGEERTSARAASGDFAPGIATAV